MTKVFSFTAEIWIYPGKAGWHFVTLPVETSEEIDYHFAHLTQGWGSLPVEVTVADVTWTTSIFPDKKSGSYLLPLKADVRKKAQLHEGQSVMFSLTFNQRP